MAKTVAAIELEFVEALLDLMHEASGPWTLDEMDADALVPHSNGYGLWFSSPANLKIGTAPLTAAEIVERVERRMNSCGARVSEQLPPWTICTLPRGHEGEHNSADAVRLRNGYARPAVKS